MKYVKMLAENGFEIEEIEPKEIILDSGFIPHGHASSIWEYSIYIKDGYIVRKGRHEFLFFFGNYAWYDDGARGETEVVGLAYLKDGKIGKGDEFIKKLIGLWKIKDGITFEEIYSHWRPKSPLERLHQFLYLIS